MKSKIIKIFSLLLLLVFFFVYQSYTEKNEIKNIVGQPKILMSNFHLTTSGGHYTYLKCILESKLRQSFDFAVATPEQSDVYELASKMELESYPCEFPGSLKELGDIFKAIFKFREICKNYKPHIIHTNGGHDNMIAVMSTFFLRNKPKIVRTFHAQKRIGRDVYHDWLYNKAISACIFVSKKLFEYNSENEGLGLKNYKIIHNGVDLSYFRPINSDLSIKKQFNINENTFVFGSCAGLSDYKRIDLMLSAVNELKNKNLDFCVLLLGTEVRGLTLEKEVKRMGLENFVYYAGHHRDIRSYVSVFDVGFILSDRVESISYASREMMAMGKPLISTNFMGLVENVDHMENGVIIEPGNLDELINAIKYFIDMPKNELINYSKRAREKAERDFSLSKQITEMRELYTELLGV